MTPADVTAIRTRLGLTQVQLAQLLGVHPLTVSKWERGLLTPSLHEQALLESFRTATKSREDIGETVGRLLMTAGVAFALYMLLKEAFGEE